MIFKITQPSSFGLEAVRVREVEAAQTRYVQLYRKIKCCACGVYPNVNGLISADLTPMQTIAVSCKSTKPCNDLDPLVMTAPISQDVNAQVMEEWERRVERAIQLVYMRSHSNKVSQEAYIERLNLRWHTSKKKRRIEGRPTVGQDNPVSFVYPGITEPYSYPYTAPYGNPAHPVAYGALTGNDDPRSKPEIAELEQRTKAHVAHLNERIAIRGAMSEPTKTKMGGRL